MRLSLGSATEIVAHLLPTSTRAFSRHSFPFVPIAMAKGGNAASETDRVLASIKALEGMISSLAKDQKSTAEKVDAFNTSFLEKINEAVQAAIGAQLTPMRKDIQELSGKYDELDVQCKELRRLIDSMNVGADGIMSDDGVGESPWTRRKLNFGGSQIGGSSASPPLSSSGSVASLNPCKVVFKGWPDCLSRDAISQFIRTDCCAGKTPVDIVSSDCESIAFAFFS